MIPPCFSVLLLCICTWLSLSPWTRPRPPFSLPLPLWTTLFPTNADYIEDVEPLVNKFVSVPKDYGSLNCAAFIAGVIHGVLLASGFVRVRAWGVLPHSFLRYEFCPELSLL